MNRFSDTRRSCRTCRRELDDEFAKPDRRICKGCELFNVTVANMKGRGHALGMTRDELLDVYGTAKTRRCFYCGISEGSYAQLRIPTPSKQPGLRLGLDRTDTCAAYTRENVVICCLVCNRIKSSTFGHNEMVQLGRRVNEIWHRRGLDAQLDP